MSHYQSEKRLHLEKTTPFGTLTRNISADEIREAAHVSRNTAYRWIESPAKIPPAALELMQFKLLGLIPGKGFEGWITKDRRLISPIMKHHGLTPAEIDNYGTAQYRARWFYKELSHRDRQTKRLEGLLDYWIQRAGGYQAANDED